MLTVLESLNQALYQVLEDDPLALLLGEDILDPYGGAFKVTQGCSTRFLIEYYPLRSPKLEWLG